MILFDFCRRWFVPEVIYTQLNGVAVNVGLADDSPHVLVPKIAEFPCFKLLNLKSCREIIGAECVQLRVV